MPFPCFIRMAAFIFMTWSFICVLLRYLPFSGILPLRGHRLRPSGHAMRQNEAFGLAVPQASGQAALPHRLAAQGYDSRP